MMTDYLHKGYKNTVTKIKVNFSDFFIASWHGVKSFDLIYASFDFVLYATEQYFFLIIKIKLMNYKLNFKLPFTSL